MFSPCRQEPPFILYMHCSVWPSQAVGYEIVSKSVTPKEFVSNLVAAGVPKLMAESLALTFTTMAGDTPR